MSTVSVGTAGPLALVVNFREPLKLLSLQHTTAKDDHDFNRLTFNSPNALITAHHWPPTIFAQRLFSLHI